MRPFALEIAAGDFALAARSSLPYRPLPASRHPEFRHGLLDRGGLDGAKPDGLAGDLVDVPGRRLRRFRFFGHAASIDRELCTFNPAERPWTCRSSDQLELTHHGPRREAGRLQPNKVGAAIDLASAPGRRLAAGTVPRRMVLRIDLAVCMGRRYDVTPATLNPEGTNSLPALNSAADRIAKAFAENGLTKHMGWEDAL